MGQALHDFFSAWVMTPEEGRDAQILGSLGARVSYADPRTDTPITSKDALVEYVAGFLPMCPPGAQVTVAEPVDMRGSVARCTVHFVMSPEMKQVGQYFAELDADGKITRLVGFSGKGAE